MRPARYNSFQMQVLHAGSHKFLLLELDYDFLASLARQAGFEVRVEEVNRAVILHLSIEDRQAPLLLFDAADPGNLGWFSRCQFYVDAGTGAVLQTPLSVANVRERDGRPQPRSLKLSITRELPANFRLPGRQPVTEQVVYAIVVNFLNALLNVGVGVCGKGCVTPLAGRTETAGPKS